MKKTTAILWSASANDRIDFGRNSAIGAFPVKAHIATGRRDNWGVCIGNRIAWTEDAADAMVTEYAPWRQA